ncbi:hypothetical protein N7481_004074 [Penicillium waksmanii]|uniref:uncharacterized protein n=1 Tax=Penicillium waksmanii TaxID=69791 RepID=UPI0025493548|nr:uncharacterized protein N7481_004074 [Penicillium waksmanii]KAJ5988864.1 hypothetical protein N7481_004074 [Penicillium waksmanii]
MPGLGMINLIIQDVRFNQAVGAVPGAEPSLGLYWVLGAMGFGFDNSWWGDALGLSPFGKKYGEWDDAQND